MSDTSEAANPAFPATRWTLILALGPRFHMTAGAVQVAVHRMRQRFRKSLEAVVAETVATPDEVEGELRHLLALLRG